MTEAEICLPSQWKQAVREFQLAFGSHFPHLLNDWIAAEREMNWLDSMVFGNPLETCRRREALRELYKLKSLIGDLADMELPGMYRAQLELTMLKEGLVDKVAAQSPGYLIEEHSPEISDAERKIIAVVTTIGEMAGNEEIPLALESLCARMERGIAEVPETGNINWEAVNAVDGLRWLWWRNNDGKHGPAKALNPASRFASFLRDGFAYLEIDADPLSAFKRWATITGGTG